ncbi:MAG: hypothetical protein QM796_07560 [Chthoniobacteraceae bacterium]
MKRLTSILLFVLSAAAVHAQSDGKEATGGSTLSSSATFKSLAPAQQEDLGDLKPAPGEEPGIHTRASFTTRVEYTTNSLMLGNHGSGDVLWMPTLELGANIPISTKLDFDLLGRAETIAYSRNDDHGFAGFSGAATLGYRYKPNWPRVYVGAEPYFYNSFSTFVNERSTIDAVGVEAGIDHSIAINHGFTLLFGGYQYSQWFSSPSIDSRDQHRILLGVSQQLRTSLFAQLFYSFQYQPLPQRGPQRPAPHCGCKSRLSH